MHSYPEGEESLYRGGGGGCCAAFNPLDAPSPFNLFHKCHFINRYTSIKTNAWQKNHKSISYNICIIPSFMWGTDPNLSLYHMDFQMNKLITNMNV